MRQIPIGTKGTFTLRVLPEHLANQFKDAMLPQVLATPVMILAMENAALNAIRPFLMAREHGRHRNSCSAPRSHAYRPYGSCRGRGDQHHRQAN